MADLGGVGGEIIYEEDKKKVSIHYGNNIVEIVRERPSTPIIDKILLLMMKKTYHRHKIFLN